MWHRGNWPALWFRSRAAQHTCSRSASATTAVRPAFPSYAGKAGYSHPTRTKPLLLMDLSSTCAGAYLSRIWNTAPTFPEPRSKPDSGTAGSRLWQPKTSCFRLRHNKAALTKARGHSRSRCDAVLSRLRQLRNSKNFSQDLQRRTGRKGTKAAHAQKEPAEPRSAVGRRKTTLPILRALPVTLNGAIRFLLQSRNMG